MSLWNHLKNVMVEQFVQDVVECYAGWSEINREFMKPAGAE